MKHFVTSIVALALLLITTPSFADEPATPQVTTFMVFANGVEGREEEFNTWYETVHLSEVLTLPGFVSAQRFQLLGDPAGGTKYLAVYEIAGDPQAALAALGAAVATTLNMSDSMDATSVVTKLFTPRTEKMVAAD
jgi:hypothetical protein